MSLKDIVETWGIKYFTFYSFTLGLLKLGFSNNFIPFLFGLISYLILFKTHKEVIEKYSSHQKNKNLKFIIFIIILMNASFFSITNGIRTGFAFALLIYVIFNYELNNKKLTLFFGSIISIAFHPSAFLPIALFLFCNIYKNIKAYRLMLFSSLLFFLISEKFFYEITYFLKPYLIYFDLYSTSQFEIDGKWSGAIDEHLSTKGYIFSTYFKGLPFYLMVINLIFTKKPTNEKLYNYLCLLVLAISIASSSYTIYERYVYYFTMFYCYYFSIELLSKPIKKPKKIFLFLLIFSLALYNLGTFYSYLDVISSMYTPFLYKPLPIMLYY